MINNKKQTRLQSPIEEAMTPVPILGTNAVAAYEAWLNDGNSLIATMFDAFQTMGPREILRHFEREGGGPVWLFAMYTDAHSTQYVLTLPQYGWWGYENAWPGLAGEHEFARITVRYPYIDPPQVTLVIRDEAVHEEVFAMLAKLTMVHRLSGG